MDKISAEKLNRKFHGAFTLIELLITVAIIGILSGIVFLLILGSGPKVRDSQRKAEVSNISRALMVSCYIPVAGPGIYDLGQLYPELVSKYPKITDYISQTPHDPKGNNSTTLYIYSVNAGKKCAVYANLENNNEPVTLPGVSQPGPGGGTGVLDAGASGWNGSSKYFQVAN